MGTCRWSWGNLLYEETVFPFINLAFIKMTDMDNQTCLLDGVYISDVHRKGAIYFNQFQSIGLKWAQPGSICITYTAASRWLTMVHKHYDNMLGNCSHNNKLKNI